MEKAKQNLINGLLKKYRGAKCELKFNNNFELLVSVILSAQCTDARVNKITPALFAVADTPQKMLLLGEDKLKGYIRSCGFFNNKAKNIMLASKDIVERFGGVVPTKKEDLLTLAGVGEKTANVMLVVANGEPAMPVDTHVFRLAHRLGFSAGKTPKKVQEDLEKLIDKSLWADFHHALIFHGRYVCKAIKPNCTTCEFNNVCPHFGQKEK